MNKFEDSDRKVFQNCEPDNILIYTVYIILKHQ